ncbi:MAG: TerC family protein [Neisseria sp.]|nr:TerC family protein [Neisseria sp.]
MDFSWLLDATTWIGFLTLLILEVVLGIDNLVFVAILANKVKPHLRDRTRIVGLGLAIVIRVVMLALVSYIMTLNTPLFSFNDFAVSGKDLVMLGGGLFLLYKATTELHDRLEGQVHYTQSGLSHVYTSMGVVVMQILVLDAVFSLDSVITAVHMVDHVTVAMAAVVVAMGVMIWASKPLTDFVEKHPTVVMLCLGFLLMIGFSLIAEGFHFQIPKGYLYAAIGFSILIEVFNQVSQKNRKEHAFSGSTWRRRTADSVLGMMGIREAVVAKASRHGESVDDGSVFEDNEKNMIRSVLTLAERAVPAVMTPRRDIERLDISQSLDAQKEQLQTTPYSRLVVIGKAGIEEPLGFVAKKDLLTQLLNTGSLNINAALRQPLILPESATVLNALELFRAHSADLALVVDEFGAVLGMVTMKDMMETIAGEFPEEFEREDAPTIQENADQTLTVDGSLEYDELAQQIPLPPLDEDADFHTVGGLMMEEMQEIPNVGDFVDYAGWRFTVEEKDGQRIDRVKIALVPEEDE